MATKKKKELTWEMLIKEARKEWKKKYMVINNRKGRKK